MPTPEPVQPTAAAAPVPPPPDDERLEALEGFAAELSGRLSPYFTVRRDNPGRTPQQWSATMPGDPPLFSFGMIDRTFFWTWDEGVSNHYSKSRDMMRNIILAELVRMGLMKS